MYERFTDTARLAVVRSQNLAKERRSDCIDSTHLLLAVLEDDGAAAMLADLGASAPAVSEHLSTLIGSRPEAAPTSDLLFTPGAKESLQLSIRVADELGHQLAAAQHILLGLIRQRGTAAQILAEFGVAPPPEPPRPSLLGRLRSGSRRRAT